MRQDPLKLPESQHLGLAALGGPLQVTGRLTLILEKRLLQKETCSRSETRTSLRVVSATLASVDVRVSQDTSGQSQCPL